MNASLFLELSEEELYMKIGESLCTGKGMFGLNDEHKKKLGKKWIESKKSEIQSVICNSDISNLLRTQSDSIALLIMIADLISDKTLPAPPFAVSALIIKIGLDKLCS